MDQIIALFNQVLDFFKNNESIASLIEMIKGFISKFLTKEEATEE